MRGFSVKLPLKQDPVEGLYSLNKNFIEGIKQNLKMLILTNPGERIMMPDFGVGLKNYLFEQKTDSVYSDIQQKIEEQVSSYLPIVKINSINFSSDSENENLIYLSINYSIPIYNLSFDLLIKI